VEEKDEKKLALPSDEVIDDDTGNSAIFTKKSIAKMRTSLFSHGVATFLAGFIGSVPNTIYAENIAVMSIHKNNIKNDEPDPFIRKMTDPYSCIPYCLAALLAIIFSFSGVLQNLLVRLPKPVIGGMELFLFGIISAPGIQLLVEQRVNYKKISNQIVTAAVLISGISGLSINLEQVELSGMSLGFVVGILLNLIVQFLKWLGNISDELTFDELVSEGLSAFGDTTAMRVIGYKKSGQSEEGYGLSAKPNASISGFAYALSGNDCRVKMNGQWISDDTIRDEIAHSDLVEIGSGESNQVVLRFRKTVNGLYVDIRTDLLEKDTKNACLNDYKAFDDDGVWFQINCSEDVPLRRVKKLIRSVDKQFCSPKTR
jgi:hypothetical protein